MNKFLIYTNPYKDIDGKVSGRVRDYLISKGAEICTEAGNDVMTLVLGGDGTMLQAIREVRSNGPFIGINLGNLGFLTEIETDNLENALDRLLRDDFVVEKRMLLEGCVDHKTAKNYFAGESLSSKTHSEPETVEAENGLKQDKASKEWIWALNDVVLTRLGSLKILSFDIYVNDRPLHEYLADGMIISTPTGSTGYNLSAGGPLASPASEVIMLTPICPHSLNQRSIILSGNDYIKIKIPISKDGGEQIMEVSFDGSHKEEVTTGDSIVIRKSEHYASIARLGKDSFLDVLCRKMSEK